MCVPFATYAEFESFIDPVDTCQPRKDAKSYTDRMLHHSPSSWRYFIRCVDDKLYSQKPVAFSPESEDDDVAHMFVDTLEENIKYLCKQCINPKNMKCTKDDAHDFIAATDSHICDSPLGKNTL